VCDIARDTTLAEISDVTISFIRGTPVTQKRIDRAAANIAVIKQAIRDRACLSGTHSSFRVRFAPHALGYDERGTPTVVGFEYGGLTIGRANWMAFTVDRLHSLKRVRDPWRSGPPEGARRFKLTDIQAAVDDRWGRPKLLEEESRRPAVTQREDEPAAPSPAPTPFRLSPNPGELPAASESSALTDRPPPSHRPDRLPR
jgi:hypothetical protein